MRDDASLSLSGDARPEASYPNAPNCDAAHGSRAACRASLPLTERKVMDKWKWEVEDAYAGPAYGAWVWIAFVAAIWGVVLWVILHRH